MAIFYLIYFFCTAPIYFKKVFANDFWKAVYSGRYLYWFGQFPHHSTFTFSPTRDTLIRDSFNWLGNLFFYGLYELGGPLVIQGFKILVVLLTVLLLHWIVNFRTHPVILIILIVFTLGIDQKTVVRNALFTVPLTVLLVALWIHFEYSNDRYALIGILPLLILWGNLHGSYLLGWFILLALACTLTIRKLPKIRRGRWLKSSLVLWSCVGLSLLGLTVVRPYPAYTLPETLKKLPVRATQSLTGLSKNAPNNLTLQEEPQSLVPAVRTVSQTLQSLILSRDIVTPVRSGEFQSPINILHSWFVWASLITGLIGLAVLLRAQSIPWTFGMALLLGMILFLTAIRMVGYLPLLTVPYILVHLSKNDHFLSHPLTLLVPSVLVALTAGVSLAVLTTVELKTLTGSPFHQLGFGFSERFTGPVPQEVLRQYPEPRFANSYGVGSFLVWKWWPHKKVLVDSKASAYDSSFLRELMETDLFVFLDRHNLNHYISERTNPATLRLNRADPPWTIALQKGGLIVLTR